MLVANENSGCRLHRRRARNLATSTALPPLPREVLELYYVESGLSLVWCASILGRSISHVWRALVRAGIPRRPRGIGGGRCIDEHAVIEIRQRVAHGEARRAIARDFAVGRKTVDAIMQRRIWAHVSKPPIVWPMPRLGCRRNVYSE